MARPRVLLTNPIDPIGEEILEDVAEIVRTPDATLATLNAMVGEADILIVRAFLPPDIFDRPHRLRGVVRHGVGLDMIPMESATAHTFRSPTCRAPTRRRWRSTRSPACCSWPAART